jgi:hypothetical protein
MTVITSILQSIRNAASYNKHELAAPRVILWPDEERLWTQCIELLRESYPALWSLGDYSPDWVGAWGKFFTSFLSIRRLFDSSVDGHRQRM